MYFEASVTWNASVRLTAASCADSPISSKSWRRFGITDPIAQLLQSPDDVSQAVVVSRQLDLARHVKDDVFCLFALFCFELAQTIDKPIEMLFEVLKAEDHAAVGPEGVLLHNILEADQIGDVEGRRVRETVIRRIQVDYVY